MLMIDLNRFKEVNDTLGHHSGDELVMNMLEDEDDAVIVRSTIDLARNLGLEVVAEGVETAEVWDELGTLGCHTAQGYFLSRPVSADDLGRWLRSRPAPAERTAA